LDEEKKAIMKPANYIVLGLGAAVAAYSASYFLKLNRLTNELEAVTKVSIYKVTIAGADLRIDVTLKNPSAGTVKVKYPFVKLVYSDTTIASSTAKDVNITIPKYGEVTLDPITVNIGFLTLATTAPALLKEYRDTGTLSLTAYVVTTINDSIPFSRPYNIKLGSGKAA
jgi:hypothetical protein